MKLDEFVLETKKLGIDLNEDMLNKLSIYASYLIEYNKTTNLTAIKDFEGIYLKHFYDSLTVYKVNDLIKLENVKSLIDVGTGAGFPGMVLAICFPNIDVTLMDSNNKKTTFLSNLAAKLNVNNVKVINSRSEEYAKDNLDKYDMVISRAVAALPILSELALPLTKEKGYFVALKSNCDEEILNAKKIINTLNGKIVLKEEFTLPYEESKRTIIVIKKVAKTPKGYPRSYNKIKEN